ncbi:MAG TPA: 23S rRNA (uracil(1939)-C(5))-methyltransferase RlmD [Candidatus Dormibacteraeota bacterium]|nr:23S rRNA (uracil(1939)-C(5))-methyltransferase RlmD [Candidatus Dormibacteraeota bacterium]
MVSIEKLVYGGDGLAHAGERTVFVPFVLPGEEVRVALKSQKKRTVWATPVEIVKVAESRIVPRCSHFKVCGGCQYQHIEPSRQSELKQDILRETLSRLGGISWPGEIRIHTAGPFEYRNRAQWAVRSAMPRAMGYFLPESSQIVPVDECPVLSPLLAKSFQQLQDLTRSNSLPGQIEEIEAFADSGDEKLALNVAFHEFTESPAMLFKFFREALPQIESLLLLDQKKNRFELSGPGFLRHQAGGFNFRVSHLSFFQVNRFLIEELLQSVVSGKKGALALDLYAGVGFFSLPLAKTFEHVIGVDANLAAIRDLRSNAEAAGLAVTSHNLHTEEFLKKLDEKPDLVVLDPPRAGLGQSTAAKLAEVHSPEIVYLSCDPSTLARDLAVLLQTERMPAGAKPNAPSYELASVELFDLFPQTHHIETLVHLRLRT